MVRSSRKGIRDDVVGEVLGLINPEFIQFRNGKANDGSNGWVSSWVSLNLHCIISVWW